jgi:glutathione S-transferase
MKFYNGSAPSPRRVRIFIAEKGIEVPTQTLDLQKGEAQTPEFKALNSLGQVPVLELDDGTAIAESVAICRYLEELHPEPPLLGADAVERARVEMWNRRIELGIYGTLGQIAVHTIPFFASRLKQMPEYAANQREVAQQQLAWLNAELDDGRPFLAGNNFSIADITGMAASMLAGFIEVEIPADLTNVRRWDESVRSRPSWEA